MGCKRKGEGLITDNCEPLGKPNKILGTSILSRESTKLMSTIEHNVTTIFYDAQLSMELYTEIFPAIPYAPSFRPVSPFSTQIMTKIYVSYT